MAFIQQASYIPPKQIYEQVADQIRFAIRSGKFPPDSRLPAERELAALFKVTRAHVREAIGALQNEGLVITRRGSGTYVCASANESLSAPAEPEAEGRPNTADFSPISAIEARLVLEPAIVRLAAKHARRDRQAEEYLDAMSKVTNIDDPAQRKLWSDSDRLFHRQLAVMTQDALMIKIADEIAKSMDQPLWNRMRDDGIHDAKRIQLYVAEHRLIYEAVANGDADAAAFYVEQHIKRVRRDIAP
ncbi:MAG TPA: GntR family transcriptional regulator [Noviherbaspirillum sp.]|nr:GntR family transcriptional regulator [Noviherbaspirillum sp.]